jgi:hypothetical protein
MHDVELELIVSVFLFLIGLVAVFGKQFPMTFRWAGYFHTINLSGLRALAFGIVSIIASLIIWLPFFGTPFISSKTLIVISLSITAASGVVVCIFEVMEWKRKGIKKRKNNENRTQGQSYVDDDDSLK